MNVPPIDIVIVSVVLLSSLIGWFRGATKEIFTLVAWGGSAILTIKLFPLGRTIIKEFVSQPLLSDIFAGIAIFIVFLILLSTLSYMFSNLVKNSVLNIPDKICGTMFGALRGLFILASIDFGLTNFVLTDNTTLLENTKLRPYVQQVSQMIFSLLPETVQEKISKRTDKQIITSNASASVSTAIPNGISNEISNGISEKISDKNHEESSGESSEVKNSQALDLAKLQIKKNKTEDTFNKTRQKLDNLLKQIE